MHPEPWYLSISPAAYRDSRRSCIYEEATAAVRTWAQRGAVQVDLQHLRHLPGGWPLVTRGEDESFVLHGSFAFAGNTGATLARSPRSPIGLAIVPGCGGTLYYPTLFEGLIVLTTHPV